MAWEHPWSVLFMTGMLITISLLIPVSFQKAMSCEAEKNTGGWGQCLSIDIYRASWYTWEKFVVTRISGKIEISQWNGGLSVKHNFWRRLHSSKSLISHPQSLFSSFKLKHNLGGSRIYTSFPFIQQWPYLLGTTAEDLDETQEWQISPHSGMERKLKKSLNMDFGVKSCQENGNFRSRYQWFSLDNLG